MLIAVSSSGPSMDSEIDSRFGRCAYFIIADTDGGGFEVLENFDNAGGGGAGIQSARYVASKGAKVVITGNCGPNAVRALEAAGVQVVLGCTGSVRDALERYKRGELMPSKEANVEAHHGRG